MTQQKIRAAILLLLTAFLLPAAATVRTPDTIQMELEDDSLSQLEARLKTIDAELPQLARFNMRSGAGSVGHSSRFHATAEHTEWVQVNLEQPTPIDQIVLVPIIFHDENNGFTAKGFPVEFRIIAGLEPGSQGTVIASFYETDRLIPRMAPLVVPCQTTASWVRVEASVLSERSMANNYEFQLAELMVFAKKKNVALGKPVTVSSTGRREGATRKKEFLTDGFGPYQMDAGVGPRTIRFNSAYHTDHDSSVTIDLNAIYPLTSIFLHCSDEDNSVPQSVPSEQLLPDLMIVEGATQADFSDAVPLFEYHKKSIHDVGPIIMRNFPEARCRYVRLTTLKNSDPNSILSLIFAEMEVFSNGENVAFNKMVSAPPKSTPGYFLTDGSNAHGLILPLREWMEQLARRHDLETERPLVIDELNRRYARQKINLQRAIWLAALLAVATGFSFLINRMIRIKAVLHVKQRLAADMHDELGANTHAIGVLGDLARDAESREELIELLDRARVFTERSGTAVRHCTNMLEANACEDPAADMQHSAQRLLADMEHEISFEGEALLKKLPPHKRMDLFFFYKECLSNIIRHSGATRANTCLKATPEKLELRVTDNGRGLSGKVPVSLKRRARLLGAHVAMATPAEGGLCIILQLNNRKWRLFK